VFVRAAQFEEPLEIHCSAEPDHIIDLTIVRNRVNIDGQIIFDTRLYSYKGTPYAPAPTIIMKAGDVCFVRLHNDLSQNTTQSTCNMHYNGFHCPDTSNLHTHGLHVSPYDDDINTTVVPGDMHTYSYHVPSDHLMGTHWYHAHYHGSTSLHVMGGLAGALLVEKADDYDLGDFGPLYDDALVLVMNHWKFDAGGDGTIFDFLSYPNLSAIYTEETIPPKAEFPLGNNNIYTVNGLYQPTHVVEAGSIQILRIIHAVALDWFEVSVNCSACTMTLVSRDGVFHPRPFLQVTSLAIPPGGRADIAIMFPVSQIGQTVALSARQTGENTFMGGSQSTQDILMTFFVQGDENSTDATFPTTELVFPSYLGSLQNATLSTTNITSVIFNALYMTTNGYIFPGLNADGPFLAEMCVNHVYELTIGGGGGGGSWHPYHQHVTHFEIVQSTGIPETIVRTGEFRDTIPDVGAVIRFRPDRFTGYYTLHCHMLQHEDQGMMQIYAIRDCDTPHIAPVISSISPEYIDGDSAVITIKGQSFVDTEQYLCDVGAGVVFSATMEDDTTITCEVFSEFRNPGTSRAGNYMKLKTQSGVVSNAVSFFFTAPPHIDHAVISNKAAKAPRLSLAGTNLGQDSKRSLCIFSTGDHSSISFSTHAITCAVPSSVLKMTAATSTVYIFLDGQTSNIYTFELP